MHTGFVLSFLFLILISVNLNGCRSLTSAETDEAMTEGGSEEKEEETFSTLGSRKIMAAYNKILTSLNALPSDFDRHQALGLSQDLNDLRELVEIFVHIFPANSSEDQFLVLHEQLRKGTEIFADFGNLRDDEAMLQARGPLLSFT
jgi:hypothetical protein